ncbi:MAG: hypothetical protein H0U95_09955 [Bacteroidetes bacterium]|nr:hypothetical protein [Bacteroidota bacterium]
MTTKTDNNGNFTFDNVAINQSSDYSYELIVKNSFINSDFRSQPDISRKSIDKSNISNTFYELRSLPLADMLTVKLNPSAPIIFPDSIYVEFKHELYNIPNPPSDFWFKRALSSSALRNGAATSLPGGLAAGLWRVNILKVKNGITTTSNDSTYINVDEAKTYTLSF